MIKDDELNNLVVFAIALLGVGGLVWWSDGVKAAFGYVIGLFVGAYIRKELMR